MSQLFKVFETYEVFTEDNATRVDAYHDPGDKSVIAIPDDGNEDQFDFDEDTEITYGEEGSFSVTDRHGHEHTFVAFLMTRASFTEHLGPRG